MATGWWFRSAIWMHALGWYTDLRFPRAANRPVPWSQAPVKPPPSSGQRPPNIVVILADDLGINDISLQGGWLADLGAPTPHIDSIARRGARFDQAYAGSSVCTVSRAALLTGRYPWRFGLEFTPTPGAMARVASSMFSEGPNWHPVVIDAEKASEVAPFQKLGMPPSEITLASLLRQRGYHTVHIGKWHLGGTPAMRPNAHGFDETLNMESGLYLPEHHPDAVNSTQPFDPIDRYLWPNMRYAVSYNGGEWFEPRGYLTDYFTDEAVTVIERNRFRPFFLYLSHWAVHAPLQASRADVDALGRSNRQHRERVYAGMVRALDRSVGRVLQALEQQGLTDNTIVIFTSDNGAPGYLGLPLVNRPYRGWKLTFFEGGVRVPLVAQWPARIRPGTVVPAPANSIDLLPTLVAAAGARLPADRVVDGVDLLPALTQGAQPPPRALFWRDGSLQAVRDGRWKLITSKRPQKDWLFDLEVDPYEKTNVAASRPQDVQRLKELLRRHSEGMPPPLWPSFIELPVAIDRTLDQPPSAQDEYTYWLN
jgi:uncharacterized sulfatase